MPRFSIDRIDEYGQPYSVWESDDISEAWDQLDSLKAALDESREPRSGKLKEVIETLMDQIWEAEGVTDTVDKIADVLFPGG